MTTVLKRQEELLYDAHKARVQRLVGRRRDFNLVYAPAFCILLIVFAISSLSPKNWGAQAEHRAAGKSIVERARAEASILASYALMR